MATVTINVNPKTLHGHQHERQRARLAPPGACSAPTSPAARRPTRSSSTSPAPGPFVIAPLTPLPDADPRHDHQRLQPARRVGQYADATATTRSSRSSSAAANIPAADGLDLAGGGSTVEGLSITGFTNGIHLTDPTGGDLITGDFIGLTPAGGAAGNSNDGLFIDGASSVTVGGTTPAARDVISANSGNGVFAQNDSGIVVQGDYVGTDPTGTVGIGNGYYGSGAGVSLSLSTSPTIGGSASARET